MNRVMSWSSIWLIAHFGCAPDSDQSEAPSPIVRDSAGVTIVENSAPRFPSAAGWTVATEPTLSIGGLNGDPEEELYRVSGAVRLDDGRLVIANSGSAEIRFFDAAGGFLRAVGSRGGGPGEFQTLSSLRRDGADSLVVLDGEQRRVTWYDLEGNLGRMATLIPRDAGGLPFLGATFGVFGDGTFFLATIDPFSAPPGPGATRGTEPTFRVARNGDLLDSLGAFPGREIYVAVGPQGARATMRIFGRASTYAVTDEAYFVGTNDQYEIARYSPSGSLQGLIRINLEPRIVERRHREAFMQTRVADLAPQARLNYEQRYEGNEPPPTFPAYADITADRSGFLWVHRYSAPGERRQAYSVFDRDGRWVTDIGLPDETSLLDIGEDHLLVLWRDEYDVEHVRLYGLERN